jgi:hypothetical protein
VCCPPPLQSIAGILDEEGFDDGSIAPVLIRLAWHASGSYSAVAKDGGSNGATIRFMPESGYGANAGDGAAHCCVFVCLCVSAASARRRRLSWPASSSTLSIACCCC